MIFQTLIIIISLAYMGLIIAFTIGLKKTFSQSKVERTQGIPISVIVAFKDEALNLPNLLEAMSHQSLPKDRFELILVNDHSVDESISIVEHFCSMRSNLKIVHLPENCSGKKAALTFGIDSAIHSLIVFTDADCIPTKSWLEFISLEATKGYHLMIGPVIMAPIDNLVRKFQALEYTSLMASGAGSCGIGHPIIASSANLAFRNDLLKISATTLNPKVSSGDDMFLLHHAKRLAKGKILFLGNRSAIVKTSTESTLQKAINQRKRWASKSIYYKDIETIASGIIVLLFNLTLIFLFIASIFKVENLFYFLLAFITKSFVDFILLRRYLSFAEQEELLKVFLPLQLAYPIYVIYSFFVGVFNKVLWKGRLVDRE